MSTFSSDTSKDLNILPTMNNSSSLSRIFLKHKRPASKFFEVIKKFPCTQLYEYY